MLIHLLAALGGALGVRLDAGSGGTVSQADGIAPYSSSVNIRFNTDGTVETGKSVNGGAVTWVSAGSWIDPISAASGDYSVRYTNRVGSADFTAPAAAEDSWVAITDTRAWGWGETTEIQDEFTCDFEVRDDVGTLTTASKQYTFKIDHVV